MRITITLSDRDGGTEVVGEHERLPPGLAIADNETGWRRRETRRADGRNALTQA
jgi:hypothetical protein